MKMVKEILRHVWHCPYCSAQFKDSDDCVSHIENSHMESPEERTEYVFACEVCGDEQFKYEDAFACEEKHKEGNDLKYRAYVDQMDKHKLVEAGRHPAQVKLK